MAEHLGGITLQEIEAAAREMPFPDNAGASASERFVLKISGLVTIRQEKGELGESAVFLQSDSLQSDADGCNGTFHPVLATGNDPITDRVWLSNAGLGGAYALDVDCTAMTIMFQQICDSGFGHLPALVIDWRGDVPAGRFYERGVANLDFVREVLLAYTEITREDLKGCLDNFHKRSLETPQRVREGHADPIWTDAGMGWPAHRPEERIQGRLIEHLRSRYTKHGVRAETHNEDGIADLVIYANTNDVAGEKIVVKEWVLELKALTDRTEGGNSVGKAAIKARLEEGVTQAIAYRDKEHARKAALCCYDMRADDESDEVCFAEIREEADAENILLWRWFLFRTSKDLRTAERAAKIKSAALQGE